MILYSACDLKLMFKEMGFLFGFIVCCLCFSVSLASDDTYKAAVIQGLNSYNDIERYLSLIKDAVRAKADLVVLPSPRGFSFESNIDTSFGLEDYDELVKVLAGASKDAGVYLVAHIFEKTRCQNKNVVVRSNLVFDRQGDIVSVYRKPLNNIANCTAAANKIGSFTTDFGVTFGVLMEEDLVLQRDLMGLKNFVVVGDWSSEIPFLTASQFASSWTFVNNVNLISTSGIYFGRAGRKTEAANLMIVDLKKVGDDQNEIVPPVVSSEVKTTSVEDLSLYIIRPLDLKASVKGYKESFCHGDLCCNFYIKSKFIGSKDDEINYGLAVFNGVRSLSRTHTIGAQTCALLTCAGIYKRSCSIGFNSNNTNIAFEKISISGNFTPESVQYPMLFTSGSDVTSKQFLFKSSLLNNSKQVTLSVDNVKNVIHFGVLGRDFSKDSVTAYTVSEPTDIYGYIFNEDTQEFFDYLWIRIRVLIFIVSIYVLEMM